MNTITRTLVERAPHCNGVFDLSVCGILSPFQLEHFSDTAGRNRNGETDRDINLSLNIMDFLIDGWGTAGGNPYAIISWWNSSNVFQSSDLVFMTFSDIRTNGLLAAVNTAIAAYAATNSLTVASIKGLPGSLAGAPQAAIADTTGGAVTNLATNYNLATGVLGLANALNTANGAQNDLGTKYNDVSSKLNSLLAELRTLAVIST